MSLLLMLVSLCPIRADAMERLDTPDYKVAFYAFDCYHIQDKNGKRYGYGYEMMQGISKYLQCTFSYVGYDKTASECDAAKRRAGYLHGGPANGKAGGKIRLFYPSGHYFIYLHEHQGGQ